jgi:hypothetical protein
LIFLGPVALNDPQDNVAPLVLVPTTAVGSIIRDAGRSGWFGSRGGEGSLSILEPAPDVRVPLTAFELSTGDRDVTQRRVRFSSVPGRVGADFSYDEVLNDGFGFDSRQPVFGADYGRSATRIQSGSIRGTFSGGEQYRIGFRDFETSFIGDESSFSAEYRRSGFIAVIEGTVNRLDIVLYERSHKASAPDSITSNQTTGAGVDLAIVADDGLEVDAYVHYDDINASQTLGGVSGDKRLQTGTAGIRGAVDVGDEGRLSFDAHGASQLDHASSWGADVQLTETLGEDHQIGVRGIRGYRLPNLGELAMPDHTRGTALVQGHTGLDAETSLEAGAFWNLRVRGLHNEIRVTSIRVNSILPVVVQTAPTTIISPRNGEAQTIHVVEEQVDARVTLAGFNFGFAGGVQLALGDRVGYFEGVPRTRATGAASVGRSLFKNTSDMTVTAEYQYNDARRDRGLELPSYGVLNLRLDLRLIDARMYLQWLNALDEKYQTVFPFLMTPRTLIYGIAWTFNG